MRIGTIFLESLSAVHAQRFDKVIAERLAGKYGAASHSTTRERVAWVGENRHRLEDLGVTSQRHICDHLEIMIMHGTLVTEQPYYRDVMSRKFWSQHEKAQRLRRYYLGAPPAEVTDG
ncbi:MAG: hypothetical protein Q4G26_09710 [Paracoccus sp. (in: a-proteobacteria)]|nr:hypothetical protein [Paracoccus sp. (in: a-proteobacteria)]